ncbi:uncharacterized protein EpC_05270 [Erwinia pyrifoliae Ep1/96]|nr:uncharacterized protein EpC_05270 [Erwinia pyrifoliae Ep1/96]
MLFESQFKHSQNKNNNFIEISTLMKRVAGGGAKSGDILHWASCYFYLTRNITACRRCCLLDIYGGGVATAFDNQLACYNACVQSTLVVDVTGL